jgi:PAS domain S-box-containing protein
MENLLKYKEIFNNITNGVAIYEAIDNGRDFIIKDINNAVEKIDAIKRVDMIGKKVTDVFPGIKKFGLLKVLEEVYKNGKPRTHLNVYKDNRISGWRENYVIKLASGEVAAIYLNLTENKVKEDKLKEIETNFKLITENSSDLISIISLSLNPKYLFVSSSYKNMLGHDTADILGTPVFKSVHPDDKKSILLEYSGTLKDALLKKITTFRTSLSYRVLHHNGSWRYIESTANIIGDKILLVSRDVTDKINNEKRLESAAMEWKETFDSLPEGVSIHSEDFNILRSNKALWEILGKNKDETLNHKCFEIFHGMKKPRDECILAKAKKSGHKETLEYFEPTLNRWLLLVCTPIKEESGQMKRYIHIVQDVTENKKTELEIVAKMEIMEKMNKLSVDRELRMVELKKKIKILEKNLNKQQV